ncbi:putative effector protein [Erysiphe necator]|uniref:Putative effector protein n=1 Tax=Uncinula necator TaxID=52586 RepID=A0A0B1P7Y8_UNCNE|nr:putative effector protein [Erysiphe necator]
MDTFLALPSGIALVAPSHVDAQDLLAAYQIFQPLTGAAQVERQEMRHTFLLDPVPQYGYNTAGLPEPLSLVGIKNELSLVSIDTKSIYAMNWTKRSSESTHNDDTLRIISSVKAISNIPSLVRLFARTARLRLAEERSRIQIGDRCHEFHNINSITRKSRCGLCAEDSHSGTCQKTKKCLNCAEPYSSDHLECPARPISWNGVFIRPNKKRFRTIRNAGHKMWCATNQQPKSTENTPPVQKTAVTEQLVARRDPSNPM